MLSQLDILAFSQIIQDFYQNNKQIINTLIVGSGGVTVVTLGSTFFKIIKSVRKQHRSRRIPRNTFAFEVIKPQSKDLKQQIYGGKYDDSLADHNIPYQQRVTNRNIRKELQDILEEKRWLLILGRTGLGKTREAVELAERYNNLGWTVFYFKPGEWLDVPARPPKEFGAGRKLLFLLDDLNYRMYRSNDEKNPKAEENLSEPLNVALQERLLNTLEKYEKFCGKAEILVIATARNEKDSQFAGEPSPWKQLQWEKYPKLWQRFTVYDLPEPSDDAIIDVLAATISNTDITPKPEQYPQIASSNDRTFRNVVENLRRLENDNLPLNINTYRPSLGKTWEKRYQEAVKRYPAAKYVYDAVDLLRQFDIPLERFIIKPTANLMVEGNIWQRLWCRFQISSALNYLVEIERIKNPRDGQIEAKKYQVEASEYASFLTNLFLRLTDKYPQKLEDSQMSFGRYLLKIKCYEEALNYFTRLIKVFPQNADFWSGRGDALRRLRRYEEAITNFDKALEINPSFESAWRDRGLALSRLKLYEEAITNFDKALKINSSFESAWICRGNALRNLKLYDEAIACYDKALEINPLYEYGWNGHGITLWSLHRYKEAITCYDKALKINPSFEAGWHGRGLVLRSLKRYEEAITNFDKALEIDPSYEYGWNGRGTGLSCLKRYEEAITCYDKALEIDPSFAASWNHRGNALRNLKCYEEAIICHDKALEIDSSYEYVWNHRGKSLLHFKRYEEAIKSFDRAIEMNSEYDFALAFRALAYKALNQLDKAQTDLANAVKLAKPKYEKNPLNWGNTLNLAFYYLAFDDIPTAKQLYELALSQNILQGYIDAAIRDLDDFLTVFPNHAEARAMRALLDSKIES